MALLFGMSYLEINLMDLLFFVLTFIGAYGVFMFLAYMLARVFFPTIDVGDDLEEETKPLKPRVHKRAHASNAVLKWSTKKNLAH